MTNLSCTICKQPTIRLQPIVEIPICKKCWQKHEVKAQYKFIAKGNAKSKFGLKDKDLADLPCYERPNPHYTTSSPMKLYLLNDIEALLKERKDNHRDQSYQEKREEVSYYIVGSKYGEKATEDIFPLMKEYNVICVDFASGHNLSHLYRARKHAIITELKEKQEPAKSYNALGLFLQLKPGDIVAIKSTGNPRGQKAYLEIIAYAVVVERNACTYWHEPERLGHCINVQFVETDLKDSFEIAGYSRTIHHIKDPQLFDMIFNSYKSATSEIIRQRIRRRNRRAGKEKNIYRLQRKESVPFTINQRHNQIQHLYQKYLETIYGQENIKIEEDYVDIKLFEEHRITFYEIKPYAFAEDCIKAGLGQLLSYAFFDSDPREKRIRIVGPYPPNEDEQDFISFLKSVLNIDFDYEYFEVS